MSVVLLLVSAAWVVLGLYSLLVMNFALDIRMRWVEQRYVYNGQNPYDIVELVTALREHRPPPECPRDNRIDPHIGPPYHRQGGYPPWAFPTAALFILPTGFLVTRIYYSVLNLLALTVIFVWAYRLGRPHSRAGGVFLAAAALAIFGFYRTLEVGQYGILINGLLIGVYYLVEKHKPVSAGIVYGMAAMKPQISALFAVSFLVRRQWKSLVAATAYVVMASLVTWALTKTNPIEMLSQMQHLVHRWIYHPDLYVEYIDPKEGGPFPQGCSSISFMLMYFHVDWDIATPLGAVLGLLATGILTWLWRNSSTLTLFAIAATAGRLWSYHLPYDNAMLVFLVVALGRLALLRPSISSVLAFGLVGLSLWTPVRGIYDAYPLPFQVFQMGSWMFGLAMLLAAEPRFHEVRNKVHLKGCDAEELSRCPERLGAQAGPLPRLRPLLLLPRSELEQFAAGSSEPPGSSRGPDGGDKPRRSLRPIANRSNGRVGRRLVRRRLRKPASAQLTRGCDGRVIPDHPGDTMTTATLAGPPRAKLPRMVEKRVGIIAVLSLCALFLAGMRWSTSRQPVLGDQGTYAVIGHELLNGRHLYADLWDHKPPGIHLTYAAAELITGYGPQQLYLLEMAALLLVLLGLYRAGTLLGGPRAGLCAGLLWRSARSSRTGKGISRTPSCS